MRKDASMVACALLAALSLNVQGAEYRWLNSWDKTLPQIPLLVEPYLKAVEAASKGSIKFIVSGPETVPAFEQLQPVVSGAFQFLFTHGAYHFGSTPVGAVAEALGGSTEKRKTSGFFAEIDKHYQKLGLKLLAIPLTGDGGYQIVLRKPLNATGDLQGHKIRGNPTYANVIRLLGGSMVTLPPSEMYTALDKGVVDGFAWPAYGVIDTRLYEVAKYVLRPAFGYGTNPMFVNLNTWNKFSDAEKKILLEEAAKSEARWLQDSARLMVEDEKALVGKGLQVVQMNDAAKAKLQQAWSDGLWELAAQKHKNEIEPLRAFARSKGL